MTIRIWFANRAKSVFEKFGASSSEAETYRDVVLAAPVVILAFFAEAPMIMVLSGESLTSRALTASIIALFFSIAISLLSPNWRSVLGAALIFLAFRSIVGFLIAWQDLMLLALAAANGVLAFVLLRPSTKPTS
jgi:hypothetical protein